MYPRNYPEDALCNSGIYCCTAAQQHSKSALPACVVSVAALLAAPSRGLPLWLIGSSARVSTCRSCCRSPCCRSIWGRSCTRGRHRTKPAPPPHTHTHTRPHPHTYTHTHTHAHIHTHTYTYTHRFRSIVRTVRGLAVVYYTKDRDSRPQFTDLPVLDVSIEAVAGRGGVDGGADLRLIHRGREPVFGPCPYPHRCLKARHVRPGKPQRDTRQINLQIRDSFTSRNAMHMARPA